MEFLFGPVDFKEKLRERDTQLTIAFVLIFGLGFGGYKLYKWHNNTIQSEAQKVFSESMEVYKQALTVEMQNKNTAEQKEKANLWDEAEVSFRIGYEQSKNSSLAPFFLAFESDAQEKQNKLEDSYKNLTEAVDGLSKKLPYYYLYSIKKSLMEIDRNEVEKGLQNLTDLVNDTNNTLKDMAAFYLGEYYWANNNVDKAKEQFQVALAYNPESTWGNLAKMRLERLG